LASSFPTSFRTPRTTTASTRLKSNRRATDKALPMSHLYRSERPSAVLRRYHFAGAGPRGRRDTVRTMATAAPRVLVVEDDENDAFLVQRALDASRRPFTPERATSLPAALD